MDRDEPETAARGGAGELPNEASLASGAAARVGAILSRAEVRAESIRQQAERSAEETRRAARHEGERVAAEARAAAERAARERVHQISELRASIAARAGSLVEGLEGGELTAARLDELVSALGEAADRVLEHAVGETGPERRPPARAHAAARSNDSDARQGDEWQPAPIADPLPEGAPIARRPARGSTARVAAVLMAIQGRPRDEVAERLERDHGLEDSDELLDDVFGRADTPA